ncbi:hypothetical protein SLEP1_g18451 [Rubroshorea leprosula]|uniref:Uncharacterized protein n=1 Tax=Rubroshorea leprosula TaxID=152421 RepID=A0AAV5IXG4_9ROSI|nr:hypothetical protein SLEP1_g18451 [Rubroshorea leprosula]
MNRVAIGTYVSYHWLAPEIRAQVEAITINWDAELDNDELERIQVVIERIELRKARIEQSNITCECQQYNSYPNTCHFDPNTSWNDEDIYEPQSGFQAPEEETCLNKNLEVQSSHLLNLAAEEVQGQLEEVENMLAEAKQEDVPKEEEEKAKVSFEVFNGESPLTKSDFNYYFVIDMVDEILQKNTYKDPFEIYLIQAKNPIKKYINCLNTSSSLESKGALLEELGRHIYWPKPKPPQNRHWRKSYGGFNFFFFEQHGGFNLRARKPRFKKTRGHALRLDPKPPWSGRKSS